MAACHYVGTVTISSSVEGIPNSVEVIPNSVEVIPTNVEGTFST